MRLHNGDHGYGVVTKLLHWLTVLALAMQFLVGYLMDPDAAADHADEQVDAFEERGERSAEEQGEAAEERFEAEVERREEGVDAMEDSPGSAVLNEVLTGAAFSDGLSGIETHVILGLTIIGLGLARLLWRRTSPLPPWAAHLSRGERSLESGLEKALLALLFVVPGTGLLLLLVDDRLLALHVAAQIALIGTVTLHVGLVLKHTLVHRNGHLSRML